MVESGMSHAARVARVVPRVNAWAITGTPLKKDMNDLFGLLLFLHYEPFCSSVELWRRLYKSFKLLFKQIIGKIALRHTKDQIRGELEIPMQKRFLIKIPFTAVEEQKYRNIYAQMCDDCGLDFTGAPLRDEWDPNDRVIIDKMRRWLSRLRQTCLYSELSSGPTRVTNTLAPSVDGPLRSVAEVLESMIEQNEADIFNEEKKWLMLMIRRGQILENALAPQRALAVWEQALEHATPIVAKYREQLQAELKVRRAKKEEEEKGKQEQKEKQEKEKANQANMDFDDDEDDDSNDSGKDDAEKRARKRLQGFYIRLRSALEVQHMCYFFIGNAYYQIKSNTDLTKPESEQFYAMEKSEVAAYENAKQVRKELLAESTKDVSKWINKLRDTIQSKGLATVPDMILDIEEVGIESQRIIDRLDTLCAIMNEHATSYGKLRDHLVRMLLAQLVDQDDDTELEGNEYEVSAKHQDELVVYMEAIRVMNAYRFSTITGQMNEMISRDVASGLALANEGQGPCSQLYLKLLQECNRFAYSEGSDSL
ncbi:Cytochrome c1 heme lyase, partial [Ascosphaera pollenicola]